MPLFRKHFDPRNCTLLELCFAATGGSYVRAAKVAAFVVAWSVVTHDLDREPTVEEYAEFWGMSRRQAFYEQARFREVFPQLETPAPMVELLDAAGQDEPADFGDLVPA